MVKSFVHERLKLFLASNRKSGISTQVGFICRDTEELDWAYAHPLLYCEGLFLLNNIICSLDYTNNNVLFHVRFDIPTEEACRYVEIFEETRQAFLYDKDNDPSYAWSFAVINDDIGHLYTLDLLSIDFLPENKGVLIKCNLEFEH